MPEGWTIIPRWTQIRGKPASYPPAPHRHLDHADLGDFGTGAGTLILYDDGIWRAPPGGGGGTGTGIVYWGDVQNKPDTFPPALHVHDAAAITTGFLLPQVVGRGDIVGGQFLRDDGFWANVTVAWANIQNLPDVFASNWGLVADKPVAFPTSWDLIDNLPPTFPADWGNIVNRPGTVVTSVTVALPTSLFVNPAAPVTAAGTLSVAFANQNPGLIFASPVSGAAAPPGMRPMDTLDLPARWRAINVVGPLSGTLTPNLDSYKGARITATGNLTVANWTGTPVNGQEYVLEVTQGGTGSYTVAWGTKYVLPENTTVPIPGGAVGKRDVYVAAYDLAADKCYVTIGPRF